MRFGRTKDKRGSQEISYVGRVMMNLSVLLKWRRFLLAAALVLLCQPAFAAKRVTLRAGASDIEILEPDGNGILVGILGFANGQGHIERYGFDGTDLGLFANNFNQTGVGFQEATAFIYVNPSLAPVPEPGTVVLLATGCVVVVGMRWGRRTANPVRS